MWKDDKCPTESVRSEFTKRHLSTCLENLNFTVSLKVIKYPHKVCPRAIAVTQAMWKGQNVYIRCWSYIPRQTEIGQKSVQVVCFRDLMTQANYYQPTPLLLTHSPFQLLSLSIQSKSSKHLTKCCNVLWRSENGIWPELCRSRSTREKKKR